MRGLLAQFFPHSPSSAVEVTRLVRLVFPDCDSQRDTKGQKQTFYVGVQRRMASLVSNPTTSLEAQLSFKDAQIEMLTAKVNELEVDVQSLRRALTAQQSFGPTSLYQDELQGWSLLYPLWLDLRPGSRGGHWVTEVFISGHQVTALKLLFHGHRVI